MPSLVILGLGRDPQILEAIPIRLEAIATGSIGVYSMVYHGCTRLWRPEGMGTAFFQLGHLCDLPALFCRFEIGDSPCCSLLSRSNTTSRAFST